MGGVEREPLAASVTLMTLPDAHLVPTLLSEYGAWAHSSIR